MLLKITDRFTRGLLAGIIAGIITKAYDILAYYLNFSTFRWLDVAGIITYGRKPLSTVEAIFATLSTWFFHALLGVIFVYLIQRLFSSDNLFLKGWFYGVTCWFLIYALIIIFKVPEFSIIPLKTSVSNFIGASIWGLVLAAVLQRLEKPSDIA